MAFRVPAKTLESLEWPQVAALLRAKCRTPGARRRLGAHGLHAADEPDVQPHGEFSDADFAADAAGAASTVHLGDGDGDWASDPEPDWEAQRVDEPEFADSLPRVRERLAETSEARQLLDDGEILPLGGLPEIHATCRRAAKGGIIAPQQLLDVRSTLAALHATAGFLAGRADRAPRIASRAAMLSDYRGLEREIERCIDSGGEVRDEASSTLKSARRESARLASQLQQRLSRYLQDPDVVKSLSDSFYTTRNDRFVLPVRADARGSVRGIVHDASRSGTTIFVEPEAVVDLNNRMRQADLLVAREIERVLRDLCGQVTAVLPTLLVDLDVLSTIDLAFARGALSLEMQAVEPIVERDGVYNLTQLRHPLLDPAEAVANDLQLGESWHVLVISGPNAGGKTVALKSLGLAALFVRAGLHVPADPGARVALADEVLSDIGDGQSLGESLSTFSAHMIRLSEIVRTASSNTLALLDEVGVGTDPGEGAALAQAILETLADSGVRVIATTHYNLLKEMAAVDSRFCNASVDFDPETLAPTYRLHLGAPGASSATSVAARMGMPQRVLQRANSLLDREDRRLDRMLSELSASRAALETEEREVARVRVESETIRDEYRVKLERLQERRDKLFRAMRDDLDSAFKQAHAEVATVIRELQRGGNARDAALARDKLQALEQQAREAEADAGVHPAAEERHDAVDWQRARAGDEVRVPGGASGQLASLPDRQGRVRVRVGSATLVLPAERVQASTGAAAPPRPAGQHVRFERAEPEAETTGNIGGGTLHCDLRGLRVAEATDRIAEALDRALSADRAAIEFIHGIGTGALKRVVREELAASPFVRAIRSGDPDHGGEGVTLVEVGASHAR